MTSFGRGRGWALAQNNEDALHRPGSTDLPRNTGLISTDASKSTKFTSLVNMIENLGINSSTPPHMIQVIKRLMKSIMQEESLKSIIDRLYDQALEDRLFGIKLAIPFGDRSFCLIDAGSKFPNPRRFILSAMQDSFAKCDEMKEKNIKQFRNAASFLGEVYNRMRLCDYSPVRVLKQPLIAYLNMLLETANAEDIEIATTQIVINGRKLYSGLPDELQKFMLNVRQVLVNRDLSASVRGMLLLMIEISNQQYSPYLSEDLQDFYASQIGDNFIIYMQRHTAECTIDTTEEDDTKTDSDDVHPTKEKEETKFDTDSVGILMTAPNMKNSSINDTVDQGNYITNLSSRLSSVTTNSVPRAIRGSGAGDLVKEYKTKKGYGHDDRFDKDYE